MKTRNRIALFSDDPDWHARRLTEALEKRGAQVVGLSFAQCAFETRSGGGRLCLPGFEDTLPDGVFVRLIDSGSMEQITLRLGLLHGLRELGVPVYNDARAIENTVDKSMASFLLNRAGLPTPPTWVSECHEAARTILERETRDGSKLVLKPLFGAQGKGLQLLDCATQLPESEEVDGVYYLQRFIDTGGNDAPGTCHDWRVLVVGGTAVAAMIRRGKGWITNVLQGAVCEAVALDDTLSQMAVKATVTLGADYAGVDIIRDRDGVHYVLEVNSVPAWKGLQGVCESDLAQTIADDFLVRLDVDARRAAAG